MSAFADYTDLRFAVADHVGNRDISDVMPRLVQMAEASLNQKLRCRQQITRDTLTFTDGTAPLPSDFLEMIHLFDATGTPMRASSIAETKLNGSQYSWYAIDGSNVLVYQFSGDRDIEYYAALPTLTASPTTTNWLLSTAPDVYLYAVGLEAARFLRDADLGVATSQLLDGALKSLRVNDERARW